MKVLLRLTGYAWAHRVHLGGAYLTMSASTVSMMFMPYFLGRP